jgi:hypothetical protein
MLRRLRRLRRRTERRTLARRGSHELAESRELVRARLHRALGGLAGGPFAIPLLDERGGGPDD